MKSVLITFDTKQNSNSNTLELLLKLLDSDITVVSVSPDELNKAIKKSVRLYDNVFLSGDFIASENITEIRERFFADSTPFYDNDDRIIGEYTTLKSVPLAIIPKSEELARRFILTYFNPTGSGYGFDCFCTQTINVASTDIEAIEQTLSEFSSTENPTITFRENKLYTEVSITAFGNSDEQAQTILDEATEKIKMLIGDDVFSIGNANIEHTVVKLLLDKKLKIATAESCTGGLVSQKITSVPNSSSVFEIGITSYSNRIKQYALSVPKEILTNFGAVSKQTAAAMAYGVKRLSGADFGISITGVAGPSSSEGKPVGTVYIALCDGEHYWVRLLNLSPLSTRDEVREAACFTAFDLARRYIECLPTLLPEYSVDADNINCLYEQPHYINSSLLFVKDNSELLTADEALEFEQIDEFISETPFALGSSSSASLDKLRQKVLKEHKAKFKLKLPNLKQLYLNFREQLLTTLDVKGFVLEYFYKAATLILVSAVIMVSLLSVRIFTDVSANSKSIASARSVWTASGELNDEGKLKDIVKLKGLNKSISGWISIDGTEINNPICDFADSDYYKSHNYLGKESDYGSLYFSKTMDLSVPYANTVIYGNNPHDGSMFADLLKYRDHHFAANSQTITFATEYGMSKYQIFAVILATDNPAHNGNEQYFDYAKTDFVSEIDFDLWVSEAKLRSIYDCSLSVQHGDSVITLVTDTDDFSSSKLVVMAKKLNEEDISEYHPLIVNSAPKFPDIWYSLHGLDNPYVYYLSGNTTVN